MRSRRSLETPLRTNILNAWRNTRIGKLGAYYLKDQFEIYRFRRHVAFRLTFIFSIGAGYFFCGYMKNMYTLGYMNGFVQNFDYTQQIINAFGGDDQAKYKTMHMRFIQDMIDRQGNVDVIDWLIAGTHCSKNSEEEVAFQCFEMAHLLDHQKIRTNSELQFDTFSPPNAK